MKVIRLGLRDTLLAIDPALVRTKLASRVTIGIVLALAVITAFSHLVHPMPVAAYGLGMILSVQGVLVVRDSGALNQAVTRGLGVVAASLSVLTASMLEAHRFYSDLAFLAVIFLAAFGRAYGPRWMAVGMYAFMAYFMAAYFHPQFSEIPWAIAGIVMSALVAQTVRFVLLPDNRLKSLKGATTAALQRAEQVVEALIAIAGDGELNEAQMERLRMRSHRLKEAVLVANGLLSGHDSGKLDEAMIALQTSLIELQLAAESVIVASAGSLPPVELLRKSIEAGANTKDFAASESESAHALGWFVQARREVIARSKALTRLPPAKPQATAKPVKISLRDRAVLTAVQITLASALAMSAGLALSRDRWFWAVLSAFLVFTNTRSRGDTMVKGTERALGTLLGIITGLLLALAIGDRPVIAGGLAGIALFLAFFNLPVSYARMTFFVSIVIALAYSLLGVLTFDLMVLRVEETVIGAVAGVLVSATVFPAHTRGPLETAVEAWYSALEDLLGALRLKQVDPGALQRLSRTLDESYSALVDAARPLGTSWQVITRPGRVRQTLALFLAATYWARLSARKRAETETTDSKGEEDMIMSLMDLLAQLKSKKAACFYVARDSIRRPPSSMPMPQRPMTDSLDTLGATLDRLYPH